MKNKGVKPRWRFVVVGTETYWEVEQQCPKQDGFQKDETRCTDALLMRTEREALEEPINHWLDESITVRG